MLWPKKIFCWFVSLPHSSVQKILRRIQNVQACIGFLYFRDTRQLKNQQIYILKLSCQFGTQFTSHICHYPVNNLSFACKFFLHKIPAFRSLTRWSLYWHLNTIMSLWGLKKNIPIVLLLEISGNRKEDAKKKVKKEITIFRENKIYIDATKVKNIAFSLLQGPERPRKATARP